MGGESLDFNHRNVLSNEERARQIEKMKNKPFKFNLQRFGHRRGKSGGKIVLSILGAAVGWFFPAAFGASGVWGGAIMGASLFGSIWSMTHQPKASDTGSIDVNRFDRAQETMSSDGQIPVIYGIRRITGNQTFHQTNADANTLHKHVVLCEGGIQGVLAVIANDYIIPTTNQQSNTVFTITNVKYQDAYVYKKGQTFRLTCNNNQFVHEIHLCTKSEIEKSRDTYWEYQLSVTSLISYINQLYSEGWQAFPYASTQNYPGDLYDAEGNVYSESPAYGSTENRQGFLNFNAQTVRGGTNYVFHDCEPPSNYNEVGGYPNMAWLDMNFIVSSELNGNPSVSAVVMGKKVYDTRTGTTAYSTNPAMCLRDFMLSPRYGLGKWITSDNLDEDSFREAANYCDEVITFRDSSNALVKAPRFSLNMVIDQKQEAISWLQEILSNFQAFLTVSNGKFKLHIEKEEPVAYQFNDENCSDLNIVPLSLSETPNKYVVKLIDPRNNWNSIAVNVEDFADQKQRQKIITKEVNLNGTIDQYQALRLARFYRDQNLVCPMTVQFTTSMQAMHLEPGDIVTIDYHDVFKSLPVRITEIKQDEEGKFQISGRQYNPTIYGDALGGGIQMYNYTTDSTYSAREQNLAPPPITGVVAYTNTDNEILVEHDPSTSGSFQEYRYYVEEVIQ